MRSAWLALGALYAATNATASSFSQSPDFAFLNDLQLNSTTDVDNSTTNDSGSLKTLSQLIQASNATVKVLSETKNGNSSIANPPVNDTNTVINFNQDGYQFIGRTTPGSDIRPEEDSTVAAITEALDSLNGIPTRSPGIRDILPLYSEGIKATISVLSTSPDWSKAQLIAAITALRDHLANDPTTRRTTEELKVAIKGSGNLRCTFAINKVNYIFTEFQYARTQVVSQSPKIALFLYEDDVLNQNYAQVATAQTIDWIAAKPQPNVAPPGLTHSSIAGNLELDFKIVDIAGGPSVDITWGDFGFGVRTALRQSLERTEGRLTAGIALFKDYRGRRQAGYILKQFANSAAEDVTVFA